MNCYMVVIKYFVKKHTTFINIMWLTWIKWACVTRG